MNECTCCAPRMGSSGVQIVCVSLGILGLVGAIVCCAIPRWKITAFTGQSIVIAQVSPSGRTEGACVCLCVFRLRNAAVVRLPSMSHSLIRLFSVRVQFLECFLRMFRSNAILKDTASIQWDPSYTQHTTITTHWFGQQRRKAIHVLD